MYSTCTDGRGVAPGRIYQYTIRTIRAGDWLRYMQEECERLSINFKILTEDKNSLVVMRNRNVKYSSVEDY